MQDKLPKKLRLKIYLLEKKAVTGWTKEDELKHKLLMLKAKRIVERKSKCAHHQSEFFVMSANPKSFLTRLFPIIKLNKQSKKATPFVS